MVKEENASDATNTSIHQSETGALATRSDAEKQNVPVFPVLKHRTPWRQMELQHA